MSLRTAIVAYDIHDNRVRRLALRTLREWRLDGQLSVHECILQAPQAQQLFTQLAKGLDPQTDCLLFAWVQAHRPTLVRGKGRTLARHAGLLRIA